MALMRAAATVGGFTMVSRVLGLARDVAIAAVLGAGSIADAFFVAFKLPNFFRRLFAEGAFAAGFIPIFSGLLAREGRESARAFAEQSLAVLLWGLLILVTLAQVAMPWVMTVMAPGFAADPAKFDLAVALTRLTFPYLLFISLVSLMGGVLNALGRFAAVAATPILLNLTLLLAVLAAAKVAPSAGYALAWGVAGAGVAQFLWLIWECHRAGMSLRLPRPRFGQGIRDLAQRMAPAALGAGVVQINLLVDNIIASFLKDGSISFLFYADRLNQLPLGVIGVALGTAILPLLSRHIARGEVDAANHSQNRAIEVGLLLTLPAAAALMLLAEPIIRVLFERGAFGPESTRATAWALAAFALGLPAYVLVKVLAPAYFARGDTRTPLKCGLWCMIANIAFSLLLVWPFAHVGQAHVGLALSTALAACLNTVLLAAGLLQRGHWVIDARLRRRMPRAALATLAMLGGLWLALMQLGSWLHGSFVLKLAALGLLVGGGGLVFLVAAQLFGAANWRGFLSGLRRQGAEAAA
jgi:putative peptidoglycan lipid II flippase